MLHMCVWILIILINILYVCQPLWSTVHPLDKRDHCWQSFFSRLTASQVLWWTQRGQAIYTISGDIENDSYIIQGKKNRIYVHTLYITVLLVAQHWIIYIASVRIFCEKQNNVLKRPLTLRSFFSSIIFIEFI